MTVPSGMFAPGGRTGLAKEKTSGVIPIQWLEAHPATARFNAKAMRTSVGAVEVIDLIINLRDGFEGIVQHLSILGMADIQGANTGIGWRLFFDKVPVFQTFFSVAIGIGAPTTDQSGRFDYLHSGDGMGRSWGTVNAWIPQGAIVQMGMNNNGGTSDPIGWAAWGMYWPISLREEWTARGWRGR